MFTNSNQFLEIVVVVIVFYPLKINIILKKNVYLGINNNNKLPIVCNLKFNHSNVIIKRNFCIKFIFLLRMWTTRCLKNNKLPTAKKG